MALIACVECGGKLSDKAKACPHCGSPVEAEPRQAIRSRYQTSAAACSKATTAEATAIASAPAATPARNQGFAAGVPQEIAVPLCSVLLPIYRWSRLCESMSRRRPTLSRRAQESRRPAFFRARPILCAHLASLADGRGDCRRKSGCACNLGPVKAIKLLGSLVAASVDAVCNHRGPRRCSTLRVLDGDL